MITNCGSIYVLNTMEEMLGYVEYSKDSLPGKLYKFKVRVGVIKRRPPRHDCFQFMLEMGREHIELILNGSSLDELKHLIFIFPERWMNVSEQRNFMSIMNKHPDAETLELVDIITSSPLLISSFYPEQIRIITWDDDKDYDHEKL